MPRTWICLAGMSLLRILDQLAAQLTGFFFHFFSIFGVVISTLR